MANLALDLFNKFYEGKNILVTGNTGFKGSWLCLWLKELGANVIGYALEANTDKDNYNLINLQDKIIDVRGDIRDEKKLKDTFNKYKPEIVFHLAAQPLVKLSYEKPKETYEVNVMGTLNVLECIKEFDSIKSGVLITTDKCYENKEQIWSYRENDSLGGYDMYSSSKACCEILISSYRNSFLNLKDYKNHNKAIASVRAGNVIGGGDWAKDRIIPDSIRCLMNSKNINVRNPKATRPWQYVLEPLYGYMLLGKKLYENGENFSSSWNFGPNEDSIINVESIVNLLIKYWGEGKWINSFDSNSFHEATFLSLDCTKAKSILGWKPYLGIEETIKYTVEWYKEFLTNDMYKFDVNQIEEYCKKIK